MSNDNNEIFEQATRDSQLVQALDQVLIDSQVFRQKAHTYHWNVEGPLFHSLHEFFGDIYEEMEDSVDEIAEHIRTLGAYPTSGFSEYAENTHISNPEPSSDLESGVMISDLLSSNEDLIDTIVQAEDVAESAGNEPVLDFVIERHDQHSMYGWKLFAHSRHG